ncbi:cytochrome P450 2C31-like isoform X4 [Lithobates pipiens]
MECLIAINTPLFLTGAVALKTCGKALCEHLGCLLVLKCVTYAQSTSPFNLSISLHMELLLNGLFRPCTFKATIESVMSPYRVSVVAVKLFRNKCNGSFLPVDGAMIPEMGDKISLMSMESSVLGIQKMLYNTYQSVMRWLPGGHKTVNRNATEMRQFITGTFTKYKDQLDANDQRNLIDAFFIKQQEEKSKSPTYFHDKNLTNVITNLFSAGMETTSTTLRWGLLLMMKYPEIQKDVQDEIDKVIGSAVPQTEHRKKMPYTDAVIHEIQRFGNIVPSNIPHATTQDVTFKGYFLPKGTYVIPLLASVLRDEDHFEKPDEFYPQHFLDSKGNFLKKEAFLPFSAGKRSCAGENLAKMELFLFFTRLLQNFTFQAPFGAKLDLTPAVGFTTPPMRHEMCAVPRT